MGRTHPEGGWFHTIGWTSGRTGCGQRRQNVASWVALPSPSWPTVMCTDPLLCLTHFGRNPLDGSTSPLKLSLSSIWPQQQEEQPNTRYYTMSQRPYLVIIMLGWVTVSLQLDPETSSEWQKSLCTNNGRRAGKNRSPMQVDNQKRGASASSVPWWCTELRDWWNERYEQVPAFS